MDEKKNLFKKLFESYMSGSSSIQRDDDDDHDCFVNFTKWLINESAFRSRT